MTKNDGLKYTGFKLISFELKDSLLFGNIKYDFIDTDDKQDKIYTSVLIGQNGTLKSRLFQKIILVFWSLNDLQNEKKVSFTDKFSLKYSINNSIVEFSNIFGDDEPESDLPWDSHPIVRINGEKKKDYKSAEMPLSIIATAIMITDRFPFPDPNNFSIYQYLGSRYRPQLASTKTFIGRVVEFVSKNIDSEAFITGVRKIVKEFLHNSNKPCITFHTQNTPRFFKGDMTVEEFFSYYEEIDQKYKDKTTAPPFKLNHYKSKIKKDTKLAKEIVDYCNELKSNSLLRGFPRTSAKAISFNLLEENDVAKLRKEFVLLDHMRQLGIVYPAEIEFLKSVQQNNTIKLEGYSIIDSSSGEYNLLGSMIGIIASIQANSLVFIDEPEISLHPNWQMKYLSFLRELLSNKEYSTCHIIVATHSHFLISDLVGINSSVIVLSRELETNILKAEQLLGQDTYCWSPDDILYNVFDVVSSRNKFVAEDIANILDKLSKGSKDGINKIEKNTYDTLIHLKKTLKNNDPFREVVKSILKKVK
jgi:hypothetical protein